MSKTTNRAGVIGAGSFGTAIANLLAYNTDVLLYSRKPEIVETINSVHQHLGTQLSKRITATHDPEELAAQCEMIFPVVPSVAFRDMMRQFSPFLRPYHLMIHGTKGFDITGTAKDDLEAELIRKNVHTMSEVIIQESVVVRVGCLSGPNLSAEIMAGQPAATVIASRFNEVIKKGQELLKSRKFHVFGSHEMLGAELAGALKNAIAVGSGILGGMGMGKNIQAMLITRGLVEMVNLGKAMGTTSKAFLGTAGIGDLIATATSEKSRNYTFGMRMAGGETLQQASENMPELAEGVRTIQIMRQLARHYKLHAPISEMLYSVVFEAFDIERAIDYLMNYPYAVDVDFV